ncbi:MAG: hypothetical protein GY870_04645 [archaeon]|nr:hypothetical protein [archaeon]
MPDKLEYTVEVIASTEKAVLVDNGTEDGVWIPLSQIEVLDGEIEKGEEIVIEMKEWLAIEKGLE